MSEDIVSKALHRALVVRRSLAGFVVHTAPVRKQIRALTGGQSVAGTGQLHHLKYLKQVFRVVHYPVYYTILSLFFYKPLLAGPFL